MVHTGGVEQAVRHRQDEDEDEDEDVADREREPGVEEPDEVADEDGRTVVDAGDEPELVDQVERAGEPRPSGLLAPRRLR